MPLPIDRIAADRPFYSGKHKRHGMNVQVIADPKGRLLCASPALAGAAHDVRATREHGIIDALPEAGITCCADKGYQGAGGTVRLPHRGQWDRISTGQHAVNRSHAKVRALIEQAIATLKSWRLLRKLRCSTTRTTSLVQAVLTPPSGQLRLRMEKLSMLAGESAGHEVGHGEVNHGFGAGRDGLVVAGQR
ncbi:hypothetical protein RKD44_000091 [Streptomyces collinus]